MDKVLIQEFLRMAFLLGQELATKDDLTESEQNFIEYLDKISELL